MSPINRIREFFSRRPQAAVPPAPSVATPPAVDQAMESYFVGRHVDEAAGLDSPSIIATVSPEHAVELFLEFLSHFNGEVYCLLKTVRAGEVVELCRQGIEIAVLASILTEFENLLQAGPLVVVSVFSLDEGLEVDLDVTKQLVVMARDLSPFTTALEARGAVRRYDRHPPCLPPLPADQADRWDREFDELCQRIGAETFIDQAD